MTARKKNPIVAGEVDATKRPLLTLRAKAIADKATIAADGDFGFDWKSIFDVLMKLLPMLMACGLMARDLRNPSRITERGVYRKCRYKFENDEQADFATQAILSDVQSVRQEELTALAAEGGGS